MSKLKMALHIISNQDDLENIPYSYLEKIRYPNYVPIEKSRVLELCVNIIYDEFCELRTLIKGDNGG